MLIDYFTRHPVAANLLMVLMVLTGVWGLRNINVQIDPDVEYNYAQIDIAWPGSSAVDTESRLVVPYEHILAGLSGLKRTASESRNGSASLTLEFEDGVNMNAAMREIESRISTVRSLPMNARPPVVRQLTYKEPVASLLISGDEYDDVAEAARMIEDDLRIRGIDDIKSSGLLTQEIAIEVPTKSLYELNRDIVSLSEEITSLNTEVPAGIVGEGEQARRLRGEAQQRSVAGFENLILRRVTEGGIVRLGDIARVELRAGRGQAALFHQGDPAVELKLHRDVQTDTLDAAAILNRWVADFAESNTQKVVVKIFRKQWHYIKDQITIMLKNGLGGLILVFVTLTIFLRMRVAFWVALGIPVTFMAGIGMFYMMGGAMTITAIVALILALGVVVDDAIVVSEQAVTSHAAQNQSAEDTVIRAASIMARPVMSSSLTTMAAFAPLLVIGGPMASIIVVIPMVLLCVIAASLVECFLILPHHLKSTLQNSDETKLNRFRQYFDNAFNYLRERIFVSTLDVALNNRRITLAIALGFWILSLALIGSGQVKLNLTTGISPVEIHTYIKYAPDASGADKANIIDDLERALADTIEALPSSPVNTVILRQNEAKFDRKTYLGSQYASLELEMTSPDQRTINNADFLANWQDRITPSANVLRLESVLTGGQGHGFPEITFTVTGDVLDDVREASQELTERLRLYSGVESATHDFARTDIEWVVSMNEEGVRLGLTTEHVARQLRASYDGYTVQTFVEEEEVTVKLILPASERNTHTSLQTVAIPTDAGMLVSLNTVADVREGSTVSTIKHIDGRIGAYVNGDVDTSIVNARDVISAMFDDAIPAVSEKYDVQITLGKLSSDKEEQLVRLQYAAGIALAFIYIVLCWLSSSYLLPLAVIVTIPLGLCGAILGHWVMGLDFTVMSILGMFALSGIVVNDAIILIAAFLSERDKGKGIHDAMISATTSRFRAVLLTSLTTIAGLSALLFERSEVSSFVLAMPVTICFGLAFATTLILFVIPALLSVIASITESVGRMERLERQ